MDLLSVFQLSRSSYYYVKNILDYDKYKEIKQEILKDRLFIYQLQKIET